MKLYEFDCWRCIHRAENMVAEAKRRRANARLRWERWAVFKVLFKLKEKNNG